MDKDELFQARTNPDFLQYLENARVDAISRKKISPLYEVLDSFLIFDLQEDFLVKNRKVLTKEYENLKYLLED